MCKWGPPAMAAGSDLHVGLGLAVTELLTSGLSECTALTQALWEGALAVSFPPLCGEGVVELQPASCSPRLSSSPICHVTHQTAQDSDGNKPAWHLPSCHIHRARDESRAARAHSWEAG